MASILKHDALLRGGEAPQPIVFNVEDVQSRARDYLFEVQQQAAELLDKARQAAAAIREEARREGLAAAEVDFEKRVAEASQKLSDQRCRTAIAACERTVEKLSHETAEWLVLWRNQTVELAARIAEKLVRREMADENELLRVWLEESLVAMRDVRDVRVIVNPDDFAIAGRFLQTLAKSIPQANTVEVLPDPEVKLGGCIVRSSHGLIDQQLESQLARLVDQLKN
jgi:flagellar assembly protein FliH